MNLEESEMLLRGEVPCIIDLDGNGHPFISETLPLEQAELTIDELKLLYLSKSTESMAKENSRLLKQLLQEVKEPEGLRRRFLAVEEDPLGQSSPEDTLGCFVKKYKPVALKVRPVLGTLPKRFRITQEMIGDPLKNIPQLLEQSPEFQPRGRYNLERKNRLDKLHPPGFLWPEEWRLMHWLVAKQNQAFAWDDSERGNFKEEFFSFMEIPTIAHIPWVEKPCRIPPAIYEEVCKMIKRKINVGFTNL